MLLVCIYIFFNFSFVNEKEVRDAFNNNIFLCIEDDKMKERKKKSLNKNGKLKKFLLHNTEEKEDEKMY